MARPIAATHRLKREDILDGAAALFASEGYASASMSSLAKACGLSKATLYHYYPTKDSILFDLLDHHSLRLLAIVVQCEAQAQSLGWTDRQTLHQLVREFLKAYERAATRHTAMLHDTRFLPAEQSALITQRQRDIVSTFHRFAQKAYPSAANTEAQRARTMMLLGMMNWTFTWLRPDGPMTYADFAEHVIQTLESGFTHA
jgi:AcrR family transcriptional regulator